MMDAYRLRASVVINTYNRASVLRSAIESIRFQRYPHVEIIVVNGPSEDGTQKILDHYKDYIKCIQCPVLNLSVSRNLGVEHSNGDIIFFIDDDAVAEPNWISNLIVAFEDPSAGGAGGFVLDNTGVSYQMKYSTVDVTGQPILSEIPTFYHSEQRLPSAQVPSLMGTNSAFRRGLLVELGGFDQEYAYFLEETELCSRIIKKGYKLLTVPDAIVHHKFAPSHLRDHKRIPVDLYPLSKSCSYFLCACNLDEASYAEVAVRYQEKKKSLLEDIVTLKSHQHVDRATAEKLSAQIEDGMRDGIIKSFEYPNGHLAKFSESKPFVPSKLLYPLTGRLRILILTQDYPPRSLGGIGRILHILARELAVLGHEISVITRSSSGVHTVDFEDGVWVHRVIRSFNVTHEDYPRADIPHLPPELANYAYCVYLEAQRIREVRGFDIILSFIWDVEGIFCTAFSDVENVVCLCTSYGLALPSKPLWQSDSTFLDNHVHPAINAESWFLEQADCIVPVSSNVLSDIENANKIKIDPKKIKVIPLGAQAISDFEPNFKSSSSSIKKVLFVGRLEKRKGVDSLFNAIPQVFAQYENAEFLVVGNSDLAHDLLKGITWKDYFNSTYSHEKWFSRVRFYGHVDDEALNAFYRECDVFVAPSLYESFGLIYVEAFRYAKACIGCSVGGVVEIIDDNVNGLLVPPSDSTALAGAIVRLLKDDALRERLGKAAVDSFNEKYTHQAYIARMLDMLRSVCFTSTV